MGVRERREREREARRKAVLDAARSLVRERGFTATTTKQIAERCELSEAALFFYFSNKDEILTSLLLEGAEYMSGGLERIARSQTPPAEKVAEIWRFFIAVQKEHPEYLLVSSYLGHPGAATAIADDVRSQLAERSRENFRKLAGVVEDALGEERSRVGADLLWASFLGLSLLRDARANMGLPAHPGDDDLLAAVELLGSGFAASG